jgi:histidinol dehydrogenase
MPEVRWSSGKKYRVSDAEIKRTAAKMISFSKRGCNISHKNVKRFHENQYENSWLVEGKNGEVLGQRIRPMHRVGLYVPGGAGIYPSTVIMNAVPALVAGVEEIVVTTPAKDGLQPAVAFVLQEL